MIICGHCDTRHHAVDTVRACAEGRTFTCDWLVPRGRTEDGEQIILECGATAIATERGFHCETGHEHVRCEVAAGEGWSYASDEEEAYQLARYGHESRLPDGKVYIPPPTPFATGW